MHQLAVLLGQQPGALLAELSGEGPIPPTPPEVPVGLPSELLRRRPDVRRAERQLAAATARIGVQTAELFPKFSLTGAAGLQSVSASDWFTGGSKFWSAGPTVQWRIFDAGRIRANVRVQNEKQEESLAVYEKALLTSLQDVENALVAYAQEQVRYRSLKDEAEANRRQDWSPARNRARTWAWPTSSMSWMPSARSTKPKTNSCKAKKPSPKTLLPFTKPSAEVGNLKRGWRRANRKHNKNL